jgi:ATP-dependent helicase HrpB
MTRACALLSERHLLPPRTATTSSDLLSTLDTWTAMPYHVQRAADDIGRIADAQFANVGSQPALTDDRFRRAILEGYPDRVAQRREKGSASLLLASGTGATLAAESGVRDGEFLVAVDVTRIPQSSIIPQSASRNPQSIRNPQSASRNTATATVRIASRVEREWLRPTSSEIVHRFDKASGRVRALAIDRYEALVLDERPLAVDPEVAANLLADAWIERGPGDEDTRLLRRMRFAGRDADLNALVRTAVYGVQSIDAVRLERALPPDVMRAVDRDAPELLAVPSGRHVRLEYLEDGTVSATVKLQEVFGLAETPRIGPRREPVLLALTAPSGRPVQLTRDLRSFWDRTYAEVRKELRGRYPKHPWPEDPWTAPPTPRAKRRT